MYFVWITGLRGPEPQIWTDEPVDGNGKPTKYVIFKTKLTAHEELLTLNDLTVKYAFECLKRIEHYE